MKKVYELCKNTQITQSYVMEHGSDLFIFLEFMNSSESTLLY
jgi:hypothetical protein